MFDSDKKKGREQFDAAILSQRLDHLEADDKTAQEPFSFGDNDNSTPPVEHSSSTKRNEMCSQLRCEAI